MSSVGGFYTTYKEDLLLDSSVNFRIFSQNSIGNYSHIFDSTNLLVSIQDMSDEAKDYLLPIDAPYSTPTAVTAQAGNTKVYVNWAKTLWDSEVIRVRLYTSTISFPVVDEQGSNGELIFEGTIYTDLDFVHRNLVNDEAHYYSVVGIDRYNRVSRKHGNLWASSCCLSCHASN